MTTESQEVLFPTTYMVIAKSLGIQPNLEFSVCPLVTVTHDANSVYEFYDMPLSVYEKGLRTPDFSWDVDNNGVIPLPFRRRDGFPEFFAKPVAIDEGSQEPVEGHVLFCGGVALGGFVDLLYITGNFSDITPSSVLIPVDNVKVIKRHAEEERLFRQDLDYGNLENYGVPILTRCGRVVLSRALELDEVEKMEEEFSKLPKKVVYERKSK